MLGRLARSHTGGPALAVALTAVLAAALHGAAVAPARAAGTGTGTAAAVTGTEVAPGSLHFGSMEPGETQSQTATLTTDARDGVAVVRAVVSGAGSLAEHLTTSVESCAVAWTSGVCGAGGAVLVEGPVSTGVDTTLDVPVPADGVAYLRVTLALDLAAPAGGEGTVTYGLDLLAPDATAAGGLSTDAGQAAGGLATTGAEAAALGAAALALVALGLTLRAWVRDRRRPAPTGWQP